MIRTRLQALEAARRKSVRRPSVKAVIVQLSEAEPDAATLAEVAQWTRLPARERRRRAPWGILMIET